MLTSANSSTADASAYGIESQLFVDSPNMLQIEAIDGLSQPQKTLPAKYFYDTKGSQLFDRICELDDYYPYRTEIALLPSIANDLSNILCEPCHIVEFGAGALTKIRILLKNFKQIDSFTPIDIAGDYLRHQAELLQQEFPALDITAIEADFTQSVCLPKSASRKIGFFPGSTIGNFQPEDATKFLKQTRETLGRDALLLIGVDTKKSPEILHRAYNDSEGVTREFNLNMLSHLNHSADANFDPNNFEHYAFYNPIEGRIEMHLISTIDQTVLLGETPIDFREGESIHTENSHKYTPSEFESLSSQSGWKSVKHWMASQQMFGVHLLQATDHD